MTRPNSISQRIGYAVEDVSSGEHSLNDALLRHFPEATTGDESPEMKFALEQALTRYIALWTRYNCEGKNND